MASKCTLPCNSTVNIYDTNSKNFSLYETMWTSLPVCVSFLFLQSKRKRKLDNCVDLFTFIFFSFA